MRLWAVWLVLPAICPLCHLLNEIHPDSASAMLSGTTSDKVHKHLHNQADTLSMAWRYERPARLPSFPCLMLDSIVTVDDCPEAHQVIYHNNVVWCLEEGGACILAVVSVPMAWTVQPAELQALPWYKVATCFFQKLDLTVSTTALQWVPLGVPASCSCFSGLCLDLSLMLCPMHKV